ncbi:MAG: PLP-dependent aminotransferase family protein [Peptococcaceae bacterium]|nr:PLP-dependent aminotransferase family protein [Peptococcaceae bacterium]
MDLNIKLDRQSKVPLYLQISNQIVREISSGTLRPGARLPAERKMAGLLGVNRSTVVNAYSELEAGGYISSHVGRGTVVAEPDGPERVETFRWQEILSGQGESLINPYNSTMSELLCQRELIAMDSGIAAPDLYPFRELAEISSEVLIAEGKNILQHNCAQGLKSLRESLAALMTVRDIQVSPENIIVLNGSQQGLDLIARILLEPGDCVIMEEPCFLGAIDIFRAYGVKLIGIPMDHEGMLADRLEMVLKRVRPKLIYTIPTFQNPAGVSMSMSRRKALLELAVRHQVPLLEDDAYGLLYFDHPPAPPLASMDKTGTVIYLGTMSKLVSPGLRLGWMAAPPDLVRLVTAAKQLTDLHSNNLVQRMVDLYCRRGLLEKHLVRVRERYRAGRDAMIGALSRFAPQEMSWNNPAGGFYVWVSLPGNLSATKLLQEAVEKKVSFVAGPAFYCNGRGDNRIRLNYTYASPDLIQQGIKILCRVIRDAMGRAGEARNTAGREILPLV